jgi:hypothetical protein
MDSGAVAAPQTEKENATNGRVKGHGGGLKVQGKPVTHSASGRTHLKQLASPATRPQVRSTLLLPTSARY